MESCRRIIATAVGWLVCELVTTWYEGSREGSKGLRIGKTRINVFVVVVGRCFAVLY